VNRGNLATQCWTEVLSGVSTPQQVTGLPIGCPPHTLASSEWALYTAPDVLAWEDILGPAHC
jgi:hypothetical protein